MGSIELNHGIASPGPASPPEQSHPAAEEGPFVRHVRRQSSLEHQRAAKLRIESQRLTKRMSAGVDRGEGDFDTSGTSSRYIPWNHPERVASRKYEGNHVSTAKYDRFFITFLPLFLFEMFSRVAYLYFLAQAVLSWLPNISPFSSGWGSTLALAFVLFVGAVKAIVEDRKRHLEDHKMNTTATTVIERHPDTGSWHEVQKKWHEVRVGDVVRVRDGELFPADLLCLHCDLDERICYVKTTNLDGETNLKVKRQLLDETHYPKGWSTDTMLNLAVEVECEMPNANLHTFRGRARFATGPTSAARRTTPVGMNEMLLRGCLLKNSHSVYGLVVYAGRETRIQMNSASPPLKIGAFDHFLNMQVGLLIAFQLGLCLLCAILSFVWRETEGMDRYYMAFDTYSVSQANPETGITYVIVTFVTFWILFSYFVPISLFVTLEIVKFWQGFVFVNFDSTMKDRAAGEGARCRNSNLNEDLGKVDYVFSDKTGTLTGNEMRLRMVAVKGAPMGDMNKALEEHPELTGFDALRFFSPAMHDALRSAQAHPERWRALVAAGGSAPDILAAADSQSGDPAAAFDDRAGHFLPYHAFDFWLNLALCHALLVEKVDGEAVGTYQGPSPDEVAIVECARAVGFEFVSRSSVKTTLSILGEQHHFETLYVNEFSSERQRMSVIMRAPDGTIRLYAKGADAMMLKRLRSDTSRELLERVHDNLHFFATKGLRTLVVGTRILDPAYFEEWSARYAIAQAELADTDDAADACLHEIESELDLIGVTAIEDKLQVAVPESIATMISAGIKVWMITGDKQETAINIAVSCRLFENTDDLLICNATSKDSALERIARLSDQARAAAGVGDANELVIDGRTLTHILGASEAEAALADLASLCTAVVVCRASPSQKARIVGVMREYEIRLARQHHRTFFGRWFAARNRNLKGKMLAIGDGANDVAMIQAADVGIGIAGKEGRQAVNNSDYAIPLFRALPRLLLVHGQLSQYRLARLIKYSFYKNVTFGAVLFYFQIYSGFSGQTLIDDISAAVYNVVFTSLPILLFALLDKPSDFDTLMKYPRTYNTSRGLSAAIFWKTGVLSGFLDAAIIFFIPFAANAPTGASSVIDVFSVGRTVNICMLGVVTIEIMLVTRFWTGWFAGACALSYFLMYPYSFILPAIYEAIGVWDMAHVGVGAAIMSSAWFWLSLLTVYAMTFSIRYFERSVKWLFRPDESMIIAELALLENRARGGGACARGSGRSSSSSSSNTSGPLDGDTRADGRGGNDVELAAQEADGPGQGAPANALSDAEANVSKRWTARIGDMSSGRWSRHRWAKEGDPLPAGPTAASSQNHNHDNRLAAFSR